MEILIETYRRLAKTVHTLYPRKFYQDFAFDHRMVGIIGPRGVGKTTFLLQYLNQHYADSDKALYVSADHLYFSQNSLFTLVDRFHKEYAGQLICIDEIHRYTAWNQTLKNIYDSYPNMKILFSGSSSFNLLKGKYDLSRRAILKKMHGFSLREYLEIQLKQSFPVLTLDNIVTNTPVVQKLSELPKLLGYVKSYCQQGYYPIFSEFTSYDAYAQALVSMMDKTIYEDISSFFALKTNNLETLRKIMYFVATSKPGELNINKLANSLGKDHITIRGYLEMLRDCGLLHYLLRHARGHALIRTPEKIYFHDPNLYYAVNHFIGMPIEVGAVRESFVLTHLKDAGLAVSFPETGDLQCQDWVFEIGGKSKTTRQIQDILLKNGFIVKDDILIGTQNTIPLYVFGFLT